MTDDLDRWDGGFASRQLQDEKTFNVAGLWMTMDELEEYIEALAQQERDDAERR